MPSEKPYGCCHSINYKELEKHDSGKFRLAFSRAVVKSHITLDEISIDGAAIWFGDYKVSCGVKKDSDEAAFKTVKSEILESFNKGEVNETLSKMSHHFGNNTYSLKDIFKDDQIRIIDTIVKEAVKKATELNEGIYRDNLELLRFMKEINIKAPKPFRTAIEIVLNAEIEKSVAAENVDIDSLNTLLSDAKNLTVDFDWGNISLEASERIVKDLTKIRDSPLDVKLIETEEKLITTLTQWPLKTELWKAQNIAFEIAQKTYNSMKEKNDEFSKVWVLAFQKLCKSLGIRLD